MKAAISGELVRISNHKDNKEEADLLPASSRLQDHTNNTEQGELERSNRTHKQIQLDDRLISQIGKGQPGAFEAFYQTVNRPLYAYLLSLMQNVQDAEDALQDTYLKIRASAHLYKPQGKPMAWVFTIARNLAMERMRRNNRQIQASIADLENDHRFATRLGITEKIMMKTILVELDEQERSIIFLHAVTGYKHREIAKSLDLPLSTVLSKYHRGLKKLRNKVSRGEGDER